LASPPDGAKSVKAPDSPSEHPGMRIRRADDGFTLIELMVVVLIIAVLLAIAIPTFIAARNRSSDRLAQTSLRTALNNARVVYSDGQSFLHADDSGLHVEDASVAFLPAGGVSSEGKRVSVDGSAGDRWYAAAWSKAGHCFFLADAGGSQPTSYLVSDTIPCRASEAAAHAAEFAADGW
jgi:type IV pilus assembly protein PilA